MFDFVGKRKIFFTISIALIVITIACCFILGVDLDVQFKGGSIITYSFDGDALDHSQVQSVVENATGAVASVQESTGEAGNTRNVLTITMSDADGLSADEQTALTAALKEAFPDSGIEQLEITNVDATMGTEFLYKCLVARFGGSGVDCCLHRHPFPHHRRLERRYDGRYCAGARRVYGVCHLCYFPVPA